jgi:Arc/MetJ-type ribon-helix-helix transcriptional regulator
MINVRVDTKTEARVEQVARRRGQSKSQVVRDALRLFLEHENGAQMHATAYDKLEHLIGCWDSGGMNLSQNTGEKFAELLRQKKTRARRSD